MQVLVAGWVGSTNLGDELVFDALRAKLAGRGAEVVALSRDPAATARDHGVAAVGQRGLPGAVRRADRVVFGGGGLLQDETSPLNLPYHLSRLWAARASRTPFAAVGVGAGRLDTRAGRSQVARTLRGPLLRGVSVRDAASAALLEDIGLPTPVLAADLALGLERPAVSAEDAVAVCLRPWTPGRKLRPAATRDRVVPDAVLAALAAGLDRVAATGLEVRFVAFQPDRDHDVHQAVAARMRAPSTASCPALGDVLHEVAGARVVVAMRYHGGVAATLAGRPAVLVGYSPKVDALAGELGAGGRLLRFAADELAALPDALAAVAPHGEAVAGARERLRERERGNDVVLDRLLEAR